MTRQAAPRPAPRTVTVTLDEASGFPGWSATCRIDFPARLVMGLEGGQLGPVLEVLEQIITEHNLPDSAGNVADHLADVDPYAGLLAIANELAVRLAPPQASGSP